jgi:beta-glucosidase
VPLDFLGVNYYSPARVAAWDGVSPRVMADGHGASAASPWVGVDDVEFLPHPELPKTSMGWPVDPTGMTELLVRLHREHPDQPVMITENGAAFPDVVGPDGTVEDHDRRSYLDAHLRACHDAITAGVPLQGYFAWSLMDNFEWAYGYERRFGLLRVDPETLERSWKDSAHWYRQVATTNRLP